MKDNPFVLFTNKIHAAPDLKTVYRLVAGIGPPWWRL